MGLPRDYTIQFVAGDTYQLVVDYVDDDGNVIDLTGETITMKFYSKTLELLSLTGGSGLTITPLVGRIQIDLTSANTTLFSGMPARKYYLRLDTSETTIMTGPVEVYQRV